MDMTIIFKMYSPFLEEKMLFGE